MWGEHIIGASCTGGRESLQAGVWWWDFQEHICILVFKLMEKPVKVKVDHDFGNNCFLMCKMIGEFV